MYRCNNGVFYSLFPPFTRGNRCSPGKSMGFLRQNSKLDLNFRPVSDIIGNVKCRCDGMVDVTDSKSVGGDTVWVRVPPPAPSRSKLCIACSDFFLQKSEHAHAAAPPFQIEPSALGFDLVLGASLESAGIYTAAIFQKSTSSVSGLSILIYSRFCLPEKQ